MHCGNCGKEIGTNTECSFCGYDPIKDGNGVAVSDGTKVSVPPVDIVLKKKKNGMAIAGFVLGFFAWNPITFILSFIFSTVGFFRAKRYRSGRALAIVGWCFCAIAVIIMVILIKQITEMA